jgi:hypothetical protein
MPECSKTHLNQSTVSKKSGKNPEPPLQKTLLRGCGWMDGPFGSKIILESRLKWKQQQQHWSLLASNKVLWTDDWGLCRSPSDVPVASADCFDPLVSPLERQLMWPVILISDNRRNTKETDLIILRRRSTPNYGTLTTHSNISLGV